jgi:GTP-binding protein
MTRGRGAFRVVVAGRPNVGKSALFNRLIRRRRSIVHNLPGMTRDVIEEEAELADGRKFRLIDTGGYDPSGRDEIPREVREKAVEAIRTADLVVLVVDASAGIMAGDRDAARIAREAGVATIVAANKIDRREGSEGEVEAWALGFDEVYGVSAEHGIGVEELLEAIGTRLPAAPELETAAESAAGAEGVDEPPREIALAVIGRPNVGKSSLLNALVGEKRSIVSEVAGTTRDSVDARLAAAGRQFRIVDTAGIRRKGKTERGPEVLSVVQARKRIEECDVAVLVVDAASGAASQDAKVASYVGDAGKGLVLVGNKWDVAGGDGDTKAAKKFTETLREEIPFAAWAPVLLTSAKTGRGVAKVLETVARVQENRYRRISTGELNRVLGRELRDKTPRTASGRRIRIYYVAQTGTAPPTITLVASRAEGLHFSESRRIENVVREIADFTGSPIRISVRGRSREEK